MEHVRTQLENSNGNSHSIWKVLNRCLPRKDQPLSTTEDQFSQANKFNKFYTSVGLSAALMAKTVAEEHNFHPFNQESNCCPINGSPHDVRCSLFEFQSVTEEEIGKIIRSLHSNKAPGLDKVTARVLKDSLPTTLSAITNRVNTSFSSNTFAQVWKFPEVIPLVNSGDADQPSNTRPISLLPIMSKVCEKAADLQFVNFLDQNGKIAKLQNGNRKLHSTETALLYYTDEILKNMDDEKVSVIVLLDMSKALDSIRHDLMLSKLRSIGVVKLTKLMWVVRGGSPQGSPRYSMRLILWGFALSFHGSSAGKLDRLELEAHFRLLDTHRQYESACYTYLLGNPKSWKGGMVEWQKMTPNPKPRNGRK
ncbi:RNA-directed DNA polymerase from mobile element jockey [Stylophora pistillata]|uniref:RNA-directed DNA polymerase from mobile element jockey n=1 Tax=Stylophora pistillata TaxID=50429 RepID=A0A2B4S9C6_STYPI|nr:RNA-directed DNA polymerase from mobile element jockey [Stylophora pistillata]